ncbi:MAG: UbiD family decarboxylase [Candidatus Methanosuratincola subterraneus]|uniref:Anhydromevalonate phosphate decarboxylase n=1 Tax=Methanosuratincola subterraneus TaxID=2593994 RepID=A0A3S3VF76_METS7|nr:MAG: UbiD family decarboxylase [Candidatus Methanosuratincola subterraneus]
MSLREFIEAERAAAGAVLEIEEEVSTDYEAAAIMKRHDGGPILVFRRLKGHSYQAAAGVCGSRERIYRAIGADKETYYRRVSWAVQNPKPPELVESGPVMEVSEPPNLEGLPIFRHYEKDPGKYITSGIVVARSADGSFQNASVHRMLVLGKDRLAIRIVPRHLYAMREDAAMLGKDLQVAIVIGTHPAVMIGVNSGPDYRVNELWVANSLLGGRMKVVKCPDVDISVPWDAEFVLEGEISADETADEGPFVDLTGTYDIVRKQPVVRIKRVMRRRDAIYQALLPGGSEHKLLMGIPKEVRMYEAIQKAVPKVKGVRLTPGGCCWFHAVVSIKKQADGDGKNAAMAALGSNPSLKHVVVVDEDVDIDSPEEVEWAIATRFQGDSDLTLIEGARGSTLDPSSDQTNILTAKLAIDATIPWSKPKEKFLRAAIPEATRGERAAERQ